MARIGAMRERVQIQQETRTPDGGGGYALGWQTLATVYARVRPLSSREQATGGGMTVSTGYEVTIRRNSTVAVTAAHRLMWGSVPLNITGVRNMDEKREYLTLDCVDGVAT